MQKAAFAFVVIAAFICGGITGGVMTKTWSTPAQAESNDEDKSDGHLTVQTLNIDVPLYKTDILYDPDGAQEIVDRENAAAYFIYDGVQVIANHNSQGFAVLDYAVPGIEAELVLDGEVSHWSCISVKDGHNKEEDIVDEDGISISEFGKDRLVLYTCKDSWEDITITVWEKEA